MTRILLQTLALALWLLAWPGTSRAEASDPLIFGVFPYLTARQVVETYQPVAAAMEKQLQRRVVLYTARDFKTFAERRRRGEYDILLLAPHLALLAKQETGYRPLLIYDKPIRGMLVVKADSAFHAVENLRDHTFAVGSVIAMTVMAAQDDLAARGLKPGRDYQTINAGTHINAAMQVINGRTDAAILAEKPYLSMQPDQRRQLRVLVQTRPLPGLVYLTHPRLRDAETRAIGSALVSLNESQDAAIVSHRNSHGELDPVSDNAFRAVRGYTFQAQNILRNLQ